MLLQVYGNENHVEGEDVDVLVPPLDGALVPAHDQVKEEVGGHAVHTGQSTPTELRLLASSGGNHLQVELQRLGDYFIQSLFENFRLYLVIQPVFPCEAVEVFLGHGDVEVADDVVPLPAQAVNHTVVHLLGDLLVLQQDDLDDFIEKVKLTPAKAAVRKSFPSKTLGSGSSGE